MKSRPTIRLAYVMEVIVGVAIAASMTRDQLTEPTTRLRLPQSPPSEWIRLVLGTSLTALALCGGCGLAVESVRRRDVTRYGLGRRIWAISALYVVINIGANLAYLFASHHFELHVWPPMTTVIGMTRY